ncbi:AMP-binding protein, partial [Amycolatopsis rhizosphaerae]
MRPSPESTASLDELLRRRAIAEPTRVVYTFFTAGGADDEHLTYAGLDAAARARAAWLSEHFFPGERVFLPGVPGSPYTKALFGCLYAGLIPVPGTDGAREVDTGALDRLSPESWAPRWQPAEFPPAVRAFHREVLRDCARLTAALDLREDDEPLGRLRANGGAALARQHYLALYAGVPATFPPTGPVTL